ncbi:MAG: ABC transporter substrate-binding protein, partial [Alphaproteobacteria bacterium]
MRVALLSLFLIVCGVGAPAALAFEIEDRALFEVEQPSHTLTIISTADRALFAPLILAFQRVNPDIAVDYTIASSVELMKAVYDEGVAFDVVVSSAMDLQTKLANDGLTQPYRSSATSLVPDWGKWRDHVFSFTQEPAAFVLSPSAFEGLAMPRTRQELISVLRNNADRFRGRVGTYDVRTSGLGYLFATQDARTSETYWRLTEIMGSLDVRLYCCSSNMIEDVSSGRIAVAYNVLGSYARARQDLVGRIEIIEPQDFTTLMLRSAVIPANAKSPAVAGAFVDHLIRASWNGEGADFYPFPEITLLSGSVDSALKPIR